MPQKNPYDPQNRHWSFRASRNAEPEGIPGVKWFVLILVLAIVVISYDRLRERQPDSPVTAQAEILQEQDEDDAQTKTLGGEPVHTEAALPMPAYAAQEPATPAVAEMKRMEASLPPVETETLVKYEMEKSPTGFVGRGAINGKEVLMLADTGASHVVIPEAIAQKIGLKKGQPLAFSTGGGAVIHYATTLDKLTLGRIEMRGVPAAINPAMQADFILLGMNVMGLLEMKIEGSKLVLQNKQHINASQGFAAEEAFKRSVKECVSQGNKFDQQALDCLRGGGR